MTVFAVGELYSPNRTTWPEGGQYHYAKGEHHLHLFFRDPSDIEIEAVKGGPTEFALAVEQDIICLLYHFEPIPWSDSPYSWHMVAADQRTLPEDVPAGMGALLTIVLTDATSGIVQAIRAVGLGTEFTNKLHKAIREQAERSFDQARYDDQLNRLFVKYPTHMLLTRAIARYTVGTPEPPAPAGRTPRGKPRR